MRIAPALFAAAIFAPHFARAGTLDASIVQMFPKDIAEIGYVDLKGAREQPWFAIARQNLLPLRFRKLEFFLSTAGLDIDNQIESLAWGTLPATRTHGEGIAGIAVGHFSPSAVEDYFTRHNLPSFDLWGLHLLNIGGGQAQNDFFLVFLDPSTAIFGQRAAIEQLLAVHFQGGKSVAKDSPLYSLVQNARQDSLAWAVWNKNSSRAALQELLPQIAQIPQAAALRDRIQAVEFDVTDQASVSAQSEIVCSTPSDAVTLAALLQAAIVYREHESTESGSRPSSIFDKIRVTANGLRLEIEIPVGADQLYSAVRSGNLLNLLQ